MALVLLLPASAAAVVRVRAASAHPSQPTLTAMPVQPFHAANVSLDQLQRAWAAAPPLNLSLAGTAGAPALAVQLRAVYSVSTIYLWLHWPNELSGPAMTGVRQQRATLTWRRATAIGGCAVVCHASFSTGNRLDDLQVVALDVDDHSLHLLLGTWQDGWWTMGYSRPLTTSDPMDVQFGDLRRAYQFGVDVASGEASSHTGGESLLLRFGPAGS